MILRQNQVWKQGDLYIRIVRVERLRVEYKTMKDLATKDGTHDHATKKEFCRLLKGATLITEARNGAPCP
jgi:hypothetical protein